MVALLSKHPQWHMTPYKIHKQLLADVTSPQNMLYYTTTCEHTNRGIVILQFLIRDVDFNSWTWGERGHLDILQDLDHTCTIGAALQAVCLSEQVGCCHNIVHMQLLKTTFISLSLARLDSGNIKLINDSGTLTLVVLNSNGWGHRFGPDQKGAPELVS